MVVTLLIVHFLIVLASLVYAGYRMKHGITLLNSFVIIFVLCCCAGLNFFDYFHDYLPQTHYSDTAIIRAAVSNIIFIVLAMIALAVEATMRKRRNHAVVVQLQTGGRSAPPLF